MFDEQAGKPGGKRLQPGKAGALRAVEQGGFLWKSMRGRFEELVDESSN